MKDSVKVACVQAEPVVLDRAATLDKLAALTAEAAPMDEPLDHARLRQRLEVRARLAELDADALDVSHAEPLADERVEVDAARVHLTPARSRRELDAVLGRHPLERLLRDEGQRAARPGAVRVVAPVADEALARVHLGAVDGRDRRRVLRRGVDRFDAAAHAGQPTRPPGPSRLRRGSRREGRRPARPHASPSPEAPRR